MTPRPTPPRHGEILTLGKYRVRARRNHGHDEGPIRVLWEILDGDRIVATQLSRPNADDCALAIAKARGQIEAAPEPRNGPFNTTLRDQRTDHRRQRQRAEEAEEE